MSNLILGQPHVHLKRKFITLQCALRHNAVPCSGTQVSDLGLFHESFCSVSIKESRSHQHDKSVFSLHVQLTDMARNVCSQKICCLVALPGMGIGLSALCGAVETTHCVCRCYCKGQSHSPRHYCPPRCNLNSNASRCFQLCFQHTCAAYAQSHSA